MVLRSTLGVAALCTGCQQLPDVTYETAHAEIGTFFDAPLCAGNLALVDDRIQELGSTLDVPLDSRFRLYWGAEGLAEYCTRDGQPTPGGCHHLDRDVSFVQSGTLEHELVHAVGDRVGAMEVFFEEGIAHVLSGALMGGQEFQVLPSSLVGLSSEGFGLASGSGATSNHFVHFLIDERGMAPLNELRKLLPRNSSRDRALEAFESVYGAPMAELEADWAERAPFSYDEIYVDPLPADRWQGDDLTIRRTLACDDVLTHGPLEGIGVPEELQEQEGMYTTATFDIVVPGIYDIGSTGERGGVHIQRGACWERASGGASIIDIDAGVAREEVLGGCRWRVTLWVEGTNDTELTLTLRRVGDAP